MCYVVRTYLKKGDRKGRCGKGREKRGKKRSEQEGRREKGEEKRGK